MPDRLRVLLAGGTGRLGTAIREVLSSCWDIHSVSLNGGPGTAPADLRNGSSREELLSGRFDLVVNTAAFSSSAACASDPAGAWLLNAVWPAALAASCHEKRIPLVHFSTDLVYAGFAPPYTEVSAELPGSWYGWTKLLGDTLILGRCPGALVLRTSVLFGRLGGTRRTFSEDILAGRVRNVFVNCWRNHTPIHWLAGILPELVGLQAKGLLLAVAAHAQSRSAFSDALLEHVGFEGEPPGQAYAPENVPLGLDLRPDRLATALGTPCPSLDAALEMEYPGRT